MAFDFQTLFSKIKSDAPLSAERMLGIDVGSSSIKVVEIEQAKQAITLRTYGELQLGPYVDKAMGESVSLKPEKLTEAIVDVMRECGVKATTGVLAMPLDSSFVTVVPITVTGTEELESKIRVEARKYIPVPLADVILDWSEINVYGSEDQQVHDILLAAVQSESYQSYQKLMRDVSMSGQPAEIEVFSTIRSIFRPDDTSVAIIDLGAESSKLYIATNGALERIHRVYVGGSTCTKRIADLRQMSFLEAEELKRWATEGSQEYDDVRKAFISTLERGVQEFKRVIEQYEARSGNQVGRIVLTGGGANFLGATSYLGDAFGREVGRSEPFGKVAYPAFMEDTLEEAGRSFSTALGAALRPLL